MLVPVLAFGQEQSSDDLSHRRHDVDKQHERHLPSGASDTSGSGKPRYGLPDAPLFQRPLVTPLNPADRGPLPVSFPS